MSVDLTRQELYELVWSKPIMHAAKQFGISGVMLGRICKERNVPRPPRGYWANLQATSPKKQGRFFKPPLPNLPEPDGNFNSLIHKEYEEREAARTDIFDPDDLNDPIKPPPPPFTESLDQFRGRIESVFPELVVPETLTEPHAIVQKLMNYDITLAAIRKRDKWADKPQYQNDKGLIYLHWLNVLINSFEFLGFDVKVRGKKYFTFHVTLLGDHKEFVIFINEKDPTLIQRKYQGKVKRKTYCFRWEREPYDYKRGNNYYEFEALTADCIKQIVMDVVVKDEKDYRDRVVSGYEHDVETRKYKIEKIAMDIERAAERKRQALAELLAKREELMNDAVVSMIHADRIRDLIEVMQAKSQSSKRPVKGLKHWVGWAKHHADALDPRSRSVEGFEVWIKKFQLKQ